MECTSESCRMETGAECPCGSGKQYAECCGCERRTGNPAEQVKMMWHKAFFYAMHEAKTERMRKRIESAYGPVMDKAADAVAESFGRYWQAVLMQSEAMKDLDAKLQKILSEMGKKQ